MMKAFWPFCKLRSRIGQCKPNKKGSQESLSAIH
jgi:hypothetical protein